MDIAPVRDLAREGGFVKGLRAALGMAEEPRIAVVAATQPRLDFLDQLCRRVASEPDDVITAFLDTAADEGLGKDGFGVVILDATLEEAARARLKAVAKARNAACKVLEVRKWSVEPPI